MTCIKRFVICTLKIESYVAESHRVSSKLFCCFYGIYFDFNKCSLRIVKEGELFAFMGKNDAIILVDIKLMS